MSEIEIFNQEVRNFAAERNWLKFHTPKNLAMAIAGEAGELAAEFQWLTPEESEVANLSREKQRDIAMEIADVFLYLIRLTDVLNIDLLDSAREKLKINELRF